MAGKYMRQVCVSCNKVRNVNNLTRVMLRYEEHYFCRDTCMKVKIPTNRFSVNDMIKFKYRKCYGVIYEVVTDIETRYQQTLSNEHYRSIKMLIEKGDVLYVHNYYKVHWLTVDQRTTYFIKHVYRNSIPEYELTKFIK